MTEADIFIRAIGIILLVAICAWAVGKALDHLGIFRRKDDD